MTHDQESAISLRLQRLIQANQALAQIESLDDLLPQLLLFAQEVTDAEASSILLYKAETETLEFALAYNEQAGAAESIINLNVELKLGEGIAGYVAQQRQSVIVEDVSRDKRFCKQIDQQSGFKTKSILCTPIVHQEELLGVVQVLNPKAKDHFNSQDLLILESFSHLAAVAMVRSRLLEALLQQERMQAQVDAAARIQKNFLPPIPNFGSKHRIYAVTQPAIFVGGDFYDFVSLEDGSFLLSVVDVSGKGLPAALIGATLWTKMRSLAPRYDKLSSFLFALNQEIIDVMAYEMFSTLVCCRYWPADGKCQIALAGHSAPLYIHKGQVESFANLTGLPLGIDPSAVFTQLDFQLDVDSSLLFFTDGITEARNPEGDFFGEDRLRQVVSEHEHEGLASPSLMAAIETWRQGTAANDDLTIVEVHRF